MPKRTGHHDEEAARALGAELKRIRQMREKSLRAVAGRTGLSAGYLHKLEAGTVPLPSPHTLHALAHELSADYRELYIAAGYPLPDRARSPGAGGSSRPSRSTRGSALGLALQGAEISAEEAAEIADYLHFLRRNRPESERPTAPPTDGG